MYGFFKSWIYRLWAFGGLAVVVAVVLFVGVNHRPGQPPPYATFGVVIGVWLAGVLILQAVGIARSRPTTTAPTTPVAVDPSHPPKPRRISWQLWLSPTPRAGGDGGRRRPPQMLTASPGRSGCPSRRWQSCFPSQDFSG